MAGYPLDEFDQVPEGFSNSRANHRRQGVHREESQATKKLGLWLIIVTAIMALIIGGAAFFLLPRLGLNKGGGNAAPLADAGGTAASQAPTSSVPKSAPPSSASTPSAAAVDRTIPVSVYNDTDVPGLAGRIADRLESDGGFARGETANWQGPAVSSSVVYYRRESQRATAEAVAQVLRITLVVQESGGSVTDIAVVLGEDAAD